MTGAEREALRAAMQLPYPSFPCNELKRPTCPNGFKDAAIPTHGLATLWARHPGELVGVPTGIASGLSVLDVDIAKGGDAGGLRTRPDCLRRGCTRRDRAAFMCCSIVETASATPPPRPGPALMYGQRAEISSGGLRMASRLSIIRSPIGRTG